MFRFFSALDTIIARICDIVVVVASAMVVGLIFFLVIARYVLEWSIVGPDEIALVSAIWLYMMGAVVASRRAEHLVVDFLPQRLTSPLLLKLHQRAVAVIMIGATAFFVYLGWEMIAFGLRRPQETPGLGLPEIIPLSAVMLASIICFGYAVRDLVTGKACHNPIESGDL